MKNKISQEELKKIKAKKLEIKKEQQIEKSIRKGKKFKARMIEQEKDPYKKNMYLKMSPQELNNHLGAEGKSNKTYRLNYRTDRYIKNIYQKDHKNQLPSIERKKYTFKRFTESKFMNYFYGVGKEKRKVRWIKQKQLLIDSKQSLYFIIIFAILFGILDLIMSLLKYFNIT